MNWNWIPNISLGNFEFGEIIDVESIGYNLTFFYLSDDSLERSYLLQGEGSSITLGKNNTFVDMECNNICYLEGDNLIKIKVKEALRKIKKIKSNLSLEITPDYIAIDELGVMIWTENGFVESIVVYRSLDYKG